MKSFRELEVWQKSHALVLDVYQVSASFPRTEQFGIISQLRRAAYSVPANIAEGFGRRTTKELLQSLNFASGSVEEMRYFVLLAGDLRYMQPLVAERLNRKIDSVGQMLGALAASLRARVSQTAMRDETVAGAAIHGKRVAGHGSRGTTKQDAIGSGRGKFEWDA